MTRVIGKPASIACLLGGLWGGLGCTDYETGFFVVNNLALEPPQCVARAEGNATFLISGALDVGLRLDYQATLLVGNQMTPRGDKENLRTETAITMIQGAEVLLLDDVGGTEAEFTVPATGVVAPDSSDDPGFGVISATLVPTSVGERISREELNSRGESKTLVAKVRVFGETVGGVEIESSEFTYVIRVCEGCLVDFPAEALTGNLCNRQGEQTPATPCRVGQDAAVDCRACNGFNDYCRTTDDL